MVSLVLNPIPNPDFLSNLTAISSFPQKCNLNQPIWNFQIKRQLLSHVQLFMTPWTVAHQAPLSMEFSRQEYWSGQPLPSPGDLPNPGIKPWSPALQVNSLPSEPPGKPDQSELLMGIGRKKQPQTLTGREQAFKSCQSTHWTSQVAQG